jgi:tetratricopeptide (TPR) repeat protein
LLEEEAAALVGDAVPAEMRERIVRTSGGNPLFLTEMAALSDVDGGEVEVPPTLRALLVARLDQLDHPERRVLERASVEGELFHRGTVQALAPEETELTPRLAALVRRDLVRPDRPVLPREDAYRFRHLLIRDAAYDALPKATRADLHRRFAEWLEEHGEGLVELDEIIGYHLEQAARCLAELGRPDHALARDASQRLGAAGERVYWRGDLQAAHSLLGRAIHLVEQPDVQVQIRFALSHFAAGDAEPLLEEAALLADARDDAAGAALARGLAAQMRLWTGEGTSEEAETLLRAALPVLEEKDDHAGLAQAWFSLANGPYIYSARYEASLNAAEMARSYEERVGRPQQRSERLCAGGLTFGPCPVGEALERIDALNSSAPVDLCRAVLLAMSARIDEARDVARTAAEHARELGLTADEEIAHVESLAGSHAAAAERLGVFYDWTDEHGLADLAFTAAWRGREYALAGRYEEAERCITQSLEHRDDTPITNARRRQVSALVAATRGEHADAERLAREGLARIHETDVLAYQGDAFCDLAEVLEAAGRREEAIAAWQEAIERYERKGIAPLVGRVRERLASLPSV